MSTGLLYHGFHISDYKYENVEYKNGTITYHVLPNSRLLICSNCKSENVIKKGGFTRRLKTVPIGTKSVFIKFFEHRLYCHQCKLSRQMNIPFADRYKSYTHAFEKYVISLSKRMTIKDVSSLVCVGWDMIKEIQKKHLKANYKNPALTNVRKIAIDEIAVGKGHNYYTVILDLDTGAIIFMNKGKGHKSVKPFYQRIKRNKVKIEAVAIDMLPSYNMACREYFPEATIVFDRFHLIQLVNRKLSDLRRMMYRETVSYIDKKALKGTRWILLKNPENLLESHNEHARLEEALRINKPLATAYYLKEELRTLWNQKNIDEAYVFLKQWVKKASSAGVPILNKIANTILGHRNGILAYYKYMISTGPLEATNNKIKNVIRQAFGYRDFEFFKLKVYSMHKMKYAIVGI